MHNIPTVCSVIEASWSAETSSIPDEWSASSRARGQCVVTALLVQTIFGGELRKADTIFQGHEETHYWNILPDTTVIDLSKRQYPDDQVLVPSEVNLHGYKDAKTR